MKASTLVLATAIVCCCVASCRAVLIASDSFCTLAGVDCYVAGVPLFGQNPTIGAPGFSGPWGISSTASMVPVAGGLSHPLTPGPVFDGELISYPIDGSVGGGNARNLSRAIDYVPTSGTYWSSVLLRKDFQSFRGDLLAGLGRSQIAETSVFSVDGTWVGFLDGGIYFISGPGPFLTELVSSAAMNVNETYFALLRYDFSTSGPDAVTATIYDGSSNQVATQTFGGLYLDQTMGRFSVLTQDFGPVPILDEWRFGTELRDVMVPEPASCVLLLVALVAIMIGNRRKTPQT